MIEDAELLRRYVESRSEAAFAELVQRRIGLVYSVALRTTRDSHRAEDVAQAVFADLARKATALVDRPVLAGWLYRSAHFAALGVVRAEQNRAAREQEAHIMQEIIGSENSAAEWEKIRPVLDDVMSELSERDRDAVVLRYFDGRAFADIGARLQLSENSARMRVERALDKLHALLASRGIRSTTAALGAVLAQQATAAVAPNGLAATVAGSALASAKAGAAPAVSIFQFMSTSKTTTVAASLVLALGFGTAGYEIYASGEAGAALAGAGRENSALSAKLHATSNRAAAMEHANANLEQSLAVARAAKAAQEKRAAVPRAAQADRAAEGEAFLARHPEVKRAAINNRRKQNAGTYVPLFKALHLTPAQIEQFLDLQVQGSGGSMVTPGGELVSYSFGGDRAEAQRQLKALLGDDGYRQLREFDVAPWQLTTELAGSLYNTPTPLTATQGEQVLRILAENRVPVDWSPTRQHDWDAIMPKLRGVLSEAQLVVFEFYHAEDKFSQAFAQSRRAAAAPGK